MNLNSINIKKTSALISLFIILSFLFSVLLWLFDFPGIRRMYVFKSAVSEKLLIESRYAPVKTMQGAVNFYIEELLLGAISEQAAPIFASGTKLSSCFIRDGVLYINLSKGFLNDDPLNADYRKKIDLFKSNIKHNFQYIKEIELFVDGKIPFMDS